MVILTPNSDLDNKGNFCSKTSQGLGSLFMTLNKGFILMIYRSYNVKILNLVKHEIGLQGDSLHLVLVPIVIRTN